MNLDNCHVELDVEPFLSNGDRRMDKSGLPGYPVRLAWAREVMGMAAPPALQPERAAG